MSHFLVYIGPGFARAFCGAANVYSLHLRAKGGYTRISVSLHDKAWHGDGAGLLSPFRVGCTVLDRKFCHFARDTKSSGVALLVDGWRLRDLFISPDHSLMGTYGRLENGFAPRICRGFV